MSSDRGRLRNEAQLSSCPNEANIVLHIAMSYISLLGKRVCVSNEHAMCSLQ